MIGAIVGDIAGSRFEFCNRKSKRFTLLKGPGGEYPCYFTDDTVMTLAVADAIMKWRDSGEESCNTLSIAAVRSMQEFGRRHPNAGYGVSFAGWLIDEKPKPYNSWGNGAAMRVSACGWFGRTLDEIKANIENKKPYVLRFRSEGNSENKIKITDLVKGALEITENDIDHILLKSDGMPTYHLAHVVDDHLMHTTHVVRGEEWLSSLPYHVQLFSAFGFKLPKYLHISQLMRLDENGAKKKLSKRDKGAGMSYYISEGYPTESVIEYVLTRLHSNF